MEQQLIKSTHEQITLNITWNNNNKCIQTYSKNNNLRILQCPPSREVVAQLHPVFRVDVD